MVCCPSGGAGPKSRSTEPLEFTCRPGVFEAKAARGRRLEKIFHSMLDEAGLNRARAQKMPAWAANDVLMVANLSVAMNIEVGVDEAADGQCGADGGPEQRVSGVDGWDCGLAAGACWPWCS